MVKINKLFLIGGIVILILLIGGLVLFTNKSTPQTPSSAVQEQTEPLIIASDLGLTLEPSKDKQKVIAKVTKLDNIKILEFQLSYTAKNNIPRGIIGDIDVRSGYKEIYLGTCSDVCHPDSDISNIKIIIKVTKSDDKVYRAEASTSL